MKTLKLINSNSVVLVDDEDYPFISKFRWKLDQNRKTKTFHVRLADNDLHQFVMALRKSICKGQMIDHINGNRLDARKVNLRFCTNTENQRNSRSKHGSSSQYKGVSWNKQSKKWQVFIHTPKQIYLGEYCSEVEAARVYNTAAIEYFGEFVRLNEIEEVHDATRR